MPKKKLTPNLKEFLKGNYRKVKQADYEGEALTYLKKLRSLASARKHKQTGKTKSKKSTASSRKKTPKKDEEIRIGKRTIKPGTKAYEIIKEGAKIKKQSIKRFASENESAIEELLKNYLIFFKKEIEDMIEEVRNLPKKAKVFIPIRGKERSKQRAIFLLHAIKKAMLELAEIYEVVFIEGAYDLSGNLHINIPMESEYKDITDGDELLEYIDDRYANITYIKND